MTFSMSENEIAEFLANDWQKRPRLFRGLFSPWIDYLAPDELAGLACEDSLPSRLVLESGGDYPWQVRQGPFFEEDLESLGDQGWSLLVRHVNVVVPPIADMLDCFSFLPPWRKEDIMVSFAPKGGSVGAHIDNYDVFLVQGMGKRRWEIGAKPMDHEELADVQDIKLLKNFKPDFVLELEPGDALYLPPRVAHHGIALENCMTYSVGFRSPSMSELLRVYADHLEKNDQGLADRYQDPSLVPGGARVGIDGAEADRLADFFFSRLPTKEALLSAFTQSMSEPLVDQECESGMCSLDEFSAKLEAGIQIRRHENVRAVCWGDGGARHGVFVNGLTLNLDNVDASLVEALTGSHAVSREVVTAIIADFKSIERLFHFYQKGWLYFIDELGSLE
jgi:50S ribosomal protein L16 3-hydroxylase